MTYISNALFLIILFLFILFIISLIIKVNIIFYKEAGPLFIFLPISPLNVCNIIFILLIINIIDIMNKTLVII